MAKRRIRTRKDLNLAMSVLSEIRKLGDGIARITKKLPPNPDSGDEPVIGPKEEALIMHFLVLVRQMAELSSSIEGILKSEDKEETERWRGYRSELKISLADSVCQIRRLCQTLKIDLLCELVPLGEERNQMKREEYRRKYPDGAWY